MELETINRQPVIIDLKKPNVLSTPQFIQNDTNTIDFIVKDNGADADLSNISRVVTNYKRPDGVVISRLLQPDGNSLSYSVGLAEMEVPGQGELELQFFSEGDAKRISTKRFKVKFSEEIGTDEVTDNEEELTILQALFIEVDEFYQQTTVYEQARQDNENARITAENQRQLNEATRQQTVSELTDLHDSVSAAVTAANDLVTTGQPIVENAETQGLYAKNQGDYAKAQGDYAKAQGDLITQIMNDGQVASVNGKTGIVTLSASDVDAYSISETDTLLNNKVDKIEGKGLSTNDYTTDEKDKLAGIEAGANNYVHPLSHPANMITVEDTDDLFTSSNVEGALKEAITKANSAFQSASDGKNNIETAIIGKGGTVSKADEIATYAELVTGIESIPEGSGGEGYVKKAFGTASSSGGYVDVNNVPGFDFKPIVIILKKTGTSLELMGFAIYVYGDVGYEFAGFQYGSPFGSVNTAGNYVKSYVESVGVGSFKVEVPNDGTYSWLVFGRS